MTDSRTPLDRLDPSFDPAPGRFRAHAHRIIFESDTKAGKAFDIGLIAAILFSLAVVLLESIEAVQAEWGTALRTIEWVLTILFTIEYMFRLWCVQRALRYARSFFGIIDLLAVLPSYLELLVPGTHYLVVIRGLRLLRIFRVLKLVQYMDDSRLLTEALWHSRRKIGIFLFSVLTAVTTLGALMYVIEGPDYGFTSIPRAIYWAIVTLTTVGYGDIVPHTPAGQFLSVVIMLIGYGVIAVPTGIVTSEMQQALSRRAAASGIAADRPDCTRCGAREHTGDARWCRICGERLPPAPPPAKETSHDHDP